MTGTERHSDQKINWLVEQGRAILDNPERVYDLAGRRLALRLIKVEDYFKKHSFHLGIVGNPNRGKSTYAYSCFRTLELYQFPAQYFDLDIYSNSGLALRGIVNWEDRPKRLDAPKKETLLSIKAYNDIKPGIVFGDFPGRPSNPYQARRVQSSDMAIVLGDDPEDRKAWHHIVSKTHTPSLWLRTRSDHTRTYPIDPTVYGLNRTPKPGGLDIITSLTRIIEVITKQIGLPMDNIWKTLPNGITPFTEPERLILQEILDFEFAPFAKGKEWD